MPVWGGHLFRDGVLFGDGLLVGGRCADWQPHWEAPF